MTGDCHAPFCGSPGVRFPRATRRCGDGPAGAGLERRRPLRPLRQEIRAGPACPAPGAARPVTLVPGAQMTDARERVNWRPILRRRNEITRIRYQVPGSLRYFQGARAPEDLDIGCAPASDTRRRERPPAQLQDRQQGNPSLHGTRGGPLRPQLEHHLHCPFPQLSGMWLPGYHEPQLSQRSRPPRNPGQSRSRSRTGTLPGRMRRARRPGSRSGQAPVVQVLPARLSVPGVQWRRRMGSIGRRAARAGLLSLASGWQWLPGGAQCPGCRTPRQAPPSMPPRRHRTGRVRQDAWPLARMRPGTHVVGRHIPPRHPRTGS